MLLTEMNKYLNQQGTLSMRAADEYDKPATLLIKVKSVDAKVETDCFYVCVEPLQGIGDLWVQHILVTWDDEELNLHFDSGPTIGSPESPEKGE